MDLHIKKPVFTHGLSTGSLFINNIASPLYLSGEKLCYDPDVNGTFLPSKTGDKLDATVLTINASDLTNELRRFYGPEITGSHTASWEKDIYGFILDLAGSFAIHSTILFRHNRQIEETAIAEKSMLRSAENTCRYFNLTKDQSALLCLPVGYIAGKMIGVRCIVAGMRSLMIEPEAGWILVIFFCRFQRHGSYAIVKSFKKPAPFPGH